MPHDEEVAKLRYMIESMGHNQGALSDQDVKAVMPERRSIWQQLRAQQTHENQQREMDQMMAPYLEELNPPEKQAPAATSPQRPRYIGGWQKTPQGLRFIRSEDQ